MAFEIVANEKRSEVWKSFWLSNAENKTRCKICFDKGRNTIYNVQKGNTKTMSDHLKRVHDPNVQKSNQVKRTCFFDK